MLLKTSSGETFFLKVNQKTPADMFAREAEGLEALAVEGGPTVPKPYLWGKDFLLLEDLSPAPRRSNYWTSFGRALAVLHNQIGDRFGFQNNNYIGSTPQPNPWTEDGHLFFDHSRLRYMSSLASKRGLLDQKTSQQLEDLSAKLPELVPKQAPSLIHGDLWGGNALTNNEGGPAIIDPAAHFGWAEADLAMTTLFGSFPNHFFSAYEEVRPLEPDYRGRFPIYNLYHLLNHVVLFGHGYLGQVRAILKRFT
jgi:fructosamine-3-kinase